MAPYAASDWARSHARTSPTFHAVIASLSFVGAGKDWARTLRHSVDALNGRGVGKFGRLGSRTSWGNRTSAESGSSSKLGIVSVTRRVMGWRGLRGFLALGAVVFSVIVCLSDAQQVGVAFACLLCDCVKLRRTRRVRSVKLLGQPYRGWIFLIFEF